MKSIPGWIRPLLLIVAAALLLIALFIFLFPTRVATLPADVRAGNPWPWPVGPLALRFIACVALSGALVFFLAALRPDVPTLSGVGAVVATIFGFQLLHLLVNLGGLDWSKPIALIWLALTVLLHVGGLVLWLRFRGLQAQESRALPPTPPAVRTVALTIFLLTGLVGAVMFLLPSVGRERWPWDLSNSVNVQLLGAIFLGVGISSLWAWRARSWYGYDIFFPAAGLFAAAALIASFLHWNLFANHPITRVIFVIVYILGALMGFVPYFLYALRLWRGLPDAAQAR